jgi:hypothetical protein
MILALLGGCATAGSNSRTALERRVWDWTDAYYQTYDASGRYLCGGELYERRQADFYRAYGKRLRAVLDRHVERYGREETISVQSCRLLPRDAEERYHSEAMARFIKWLEQAERELGLH